MIVGRGQTVYWKGSNVTVYEKNSDGSDQTTLLKGWPNGQGFVSSGTKLALVDRVAYLITKYLNNRVVPNSFQGGFRAWYDECYTSVQDNMQHIFHPFHFCFEQNQSKMFNCIIANVQTYKAINRAAP
ncbi:hypothetical protein E5D57_003201 [Metarhizium anisopliae]|nr:hypothetical protein E5D57_003201 [Metarhizium anisopliae]